MPEDRDIVEKGANGEESSWLTQYYTASKNTGDIDSILPEVGPTPAELLGATPSEKYDVTGQVGLGGMKKVHRAHDRNADRDVALAMLRDDAPKSSKERRFVREARITAALEHPNIVPIHEIGLDANSRPYFTMKLLGGENLHDILNRLDADDPVYVKQYPLVRRLEIFQNVCHAIAFAHSRGVVHLDVKPANIQVGSFGEVLVLDWGLAKVLDADPNSLTNGRLHLPENLREVPVEGAVRGTPGYMAPEQERGDYTALDQRTDIYALGAVLQAMVYGKRSAREGKPSRKVSPALEAVVAKAMAKDAARRYATVQDLARDVRAFLGGFAVSAQSVGFGTLIWLFVKRHKAVSGVLAASLTTIAVVATVFIVKITQNERRLMDTVAQLRDEQAEKLRIGKYAVPQLLNHADLLLRTGSNEEAIAELNLIVTLDSSLLDAWVRKGFMHLGRQEFDVAMLCFDRSPAFARRPKRDKILRAGEIAEKYMQLSEPSGALTYPQLTQLLEDLTRPGNGISAQMQELAMRQLFERVNQTGSSNTEHLEFVGSALCMMNPPSTTTTFFYQLMPAGLIVDLHGPQVTQLMPLMGLRMYSLDISGTAVSELSWLRNSGLQVLNLSGTPVRELSTIFDLPITRLRLVNCPNYRTEQLKGFSYLERVVVSQRVALPTEKLFVFNRQPPLVFAE